MTKELLRVKKRNGTLASYDPNKINKCAERACAGLEGVSASELILDSELKIFDKITTEEIDKTLLLEARSKMYKEPNWGLVASRILASCVYKEVLKESVDSDTFDSDYRAAFIKNIKRGIKDGILSDKLLAFDLKRLAAKLVPSRDDTIDYAAMQNLSDRYFLRDRSKKLLETPQAFYMRVAMGVSIPEFGFGKIDPNEVAEKLYDIYSTKLASPSTPTLFNAGTNKNQLISCFLSNIPDSIDGIFDGLWQEARKSKYAGGLGFHVSSIRGTGANIKGTNGKSSGLIPWLKVYNDMLIACDQAGKRVGSGCAYLEPWHIDVEEFLDLRKSNGEERRRCHDLNFALWCSDVFFKRIQQDGQWTLLCPSECPDLTELYADEFEKRYVEYEKMFDDGKIKLGKRIKAKDLWKLVLKSLFETSHPWITYKDASNKRYSNKHQGTIHGSNLCVAPETEILTDKGYRRIEDLAGNDITIWNGEEWSLARCEKTGFNKILQVRVNIVGFGGLKFSRDINVTEYHKFYDSGNNEIRARELKVGTVLESWTDPYTRLKYENSTVEFVGEPDRLDNTYCVYEPKRNRVVFNGILTGNCTEIFLHNKPSQYEDGVKTEIGETAVCCLSSINVSNHLDEKGKVDKEKVADTVKWLIRALDNVIEQNYYPTKEAEKSAKLHRALGLGTMGWFDMYVKKGIPCDSDKAIEIADQLTELISYNAINASADLARERGNYPTFDGSEWSKGIVPIDNYEGDIGGGGKLNWDVLREKVKGGIRNSNLMAVAPNASIAYQHGCEQSHEPIFSVIFTYENKSGNYYIVNRHFINDMKKEGIWSPAFAEAVKTVDGDVTRLDIPQKYKDLYKKCFDRDMFKLIDACAARQKWVDQGLSFNLYNGGTSLKYLNDIYMHCWKRGLKSTYYLRNKPASKVAAVTTVEDPKKKELEEFNKMMDEAKRKAENGESCEMCQG